MSDFRHGYVYEDDKVGGLLILFIAMVVSTELFYCLILSAQTSYVLVHLPKVQGILSGLSMMFIVSSIVLAVILYRAPKHAMRAVKIYFIGRLIFFTACNLCVYLFNLFDYSTINMVMGETAPTPLSITINSLVLPVLYTLVFTIVWGMYFSRSKRVKSLYIEKTIQQAKISHGDAGEE